MKVVVTGGAGFIGSHIVESLLLKGHSVKVYDNFSSGTHENLKNLDCEIIEGNILDFEKLSKAIVGADIVSHQAAQLEIFRSTDDPVFDIEVNVIGTLNVLKACQSAGVQKVMNASSACVYGQAHGPTSESSELRPNWAYGVSKLAAEKYGAIYNDYHDLPVTSFRYGIVYGEREWFRRVLTIFVKRAIEKKPLVVFGDGAQIRDFVHVSDVVRCHNLALESSSSGGQTYNIGSGSPTTITELARKVVEAMGENIEILHEETPQGAFSTLVPDKRRNTAELKSMWLDIAKAQQEWGWSPQVSLIDGLKRSIHWATQNKHRWQKIQYSGLNP